MTSSSILRLWYSSKDDLGGKVSQEQREDRARGIDLAYQVSEGETNSRCHATDERYICTCLTAYQYCHSKQLVVE